MEIMTRFLAPCILIASVFILGLQAADPTPTETYDLARYCSGPKIVVNSAAFLTLNKNDLTGTSCVVDVEERWLTTDSRLRLQIVSLDAPCNFQASLQILDGPTSVSFPAQICTDGEKRYQAMYLILGNTVTLKITAQIPTAKEVTMKLLVTASGYSSNWGEEDYRCVNNLRIVKGLICDGNNNCGDGSDESFDLCNWQLGKDTSKLALVFGLLLLAAVIIIVLLVYYIRRIKEQYRKKEQGLVQNEGQGNPSP